MSNYEYNNKYKTSDCTIQCLDGTMEYHRLMLILHSDYLDAYFKGVFADNLNIINIDCTLEIMKILTMYIYNKNLDLAHRPYSQTQEVLRICDKYLFNENIIRAIRRDTGTYTYYERSKYDITIEKCSRSCIRELEDVDMYNLWVLDEYISHLYVFHTPGLHLGSRLQEYINSVIKRSNYYNGKKYDFYDLTNSKIWKNIPGGEFEFQVKTHEYFFGNGNSGFNCGKVFLVWYSKDAKEDKEDKEDKTCVPERWLYFFAKAGSKIKFSKLEQGVRYIISMPVFMYTDCSMYEDPDDELY